MQFIVKHGSWLALHLRETGNPTDVAVRPSWQEVEIYLMRLKILRKLGRSGSLLVMPRSTESMDLFESMGFSEIVEESKGTQTMEYKHE
jgi:hypothetical protein